jgi:hypothetical protein
MNRQKVSVAARQHGRKDEAGQRKKKQSKQADQSKQDLLAALSELLIHTAQIQQIDFLHACHLQHVRQN